MEVTTRLLGRGLGLILERGLEPLEPSLSRHSLGTAQRDGAGGSSGVSPAALLLARSSVQWGSEEKGSPWGPQSSAAREGPQAGWKVGHGSAARGAQPQPRCHRGTSSRRGERPKGLFVLKH